MKIQLFQIVILLFILGCTSNNSVFILKNKGVEARIMKLGNNQLAYLAIKNGQVVIDTSLLGINVNKKILGSNSEIKLIGTTIEEFDYSLFGVKSKTNCRNKISKFEILENDNFKWFVEFHISDEGVAYRYVIPVEGKNKIYGEISSFKVPVNTKVWYFERNNHWKLKSYAGEWFSADISQMPTISKMGPIQGLTLTCELPNGGYALLAEAALFNYSGMRLEAIGNNIFRANFTEGAKGFEIEGEIVTPWRCIVLADDLNSLVNNTLVPSLNPKPDGKLFTDMSWIKPGKAAWYWWSGKTPTFDAERRTVNNAAKLGFEYTMVDEGWERWDNKWKTTTQLCDYAKENGISIFLWKHSKEINFPENNWAVMAAFLDSVKQTGAVGIKVDFMNGESKHLIDFDEALLRLAAQRRLMVNFHGCQKSSGEYRTYPNEVTREGIRGIELNKMEEGSLSASHNAALPFTRFVTGHADYTPLAFTAPGETTWAHQLATLVCFYSPFQCIAEDPVFLLNSKEIQPALNFIKSVPSVWDETIVLPESKIGELAMIARRKGHDWYVGILNGGDVKHLNFECDFLPEGKYMTELFFDAAKEEPINLEGLNPLANITKYSTAVPFKKEEKVSDNKTILSLDIKAKGGAAIWFISKNN